MKTRRDIFGGLMLAAAALLCLTGCKKDDEGEKITLGVDFEQTAGMQKTYVGNGDRTIYWNVGDEVNINGTACEVHDGAVEVTLSDDGYAAVYPKTGTLNGSGKNCTGGTVVIPATQEYTEKDGHQVLGGPMAARLDSKTGRLLFRNLYAVIKVTVKAKETEAFTLSSITVESTKDLAGTETFSFVQSIKTGKMDSVGITKVESCSTFVTLNFGTPVTIPQGETKDFYLYTVPFSGAALTIKINENMKDNPEKERTSVTVPRSRLGYTTVDAARLTVPFGSIGRFSVSATEKVTFSPGNLQWSATNGGSELTTHAVAVAGDGTAAGTWRFAEHQYDYIGNANNNISSSYNGWIDLFGWGTSGWDNRNKCYQPYDNSQATSGEYADSKGYGYGPTDGTIYTISLSDESYKNADWGVYNEIQSYDGSTIYPAGTWRTLTYAEWSYLLGTGTGTRGANSGWWIYNMVTITGVGSAGVTGLIIYPDGVTAKPEGVTADLTPNNNTAVAITKAEFETLEAMGCVFLPAAGYRKGAFFFDAGSDGSYWSSTYYYSNRAYYLNFCAVPMNPDCHSNRFYGLSVRLVKEVE